jgi:hypothetical protein
VTDRLALRITRQDAERLIDQLIATGETLLGREKNRDASWNGDRERWIATTTDGLRHAYTSDAAAGEFLQRAAPSALRVRTSEPPDGSLDLGTLRAGVETLRSLRERLSYAEPAEQPSDPVTEDALARVLRTCERLPAVARRLERRHNKRASLTLTDEYDVQDLLHALLLIDFDDVRDESANPQFLQAGSRIDLLVPAHGIAIEVKMTRKSLRIKELTDQLAIDIVRYSDIAANRGARILVIHVHDPLHKVPNDAGLRSDLERASDRLQVRAVITH